LTASGLTFQLVMLLVVYCTNLSTLKSENYPCSEVLHHEGVLDGGR